MISRSGTLFQPRGLFLASAGVLRPQSGAVDMSSLHFGKPHMGFGERGKRQSTSRSSNQIYIDRGPGVRSNSKIKIPATLKTVLLCKELYKVHGA